MPDPWMQTCDGRRVDLDRVPMPGAITLDALITGLSQVNRWCGQTSGGPIPVALHSIWCCDAILYEDGDNVAAAYALLHDGHEAYMGDLTTPVVDGLAARAGAISPLADAALRRAVKEMKADIDRAIFRLVGLPEDWPPGVRETVKRYDLRLLETERRRHLDRPIDPRRRWFYDDDPPRQARIPTRLMPPAEVAILFRHRLDTVVPRAKVLLGQRLS